MADITITINGIKCTAKEGESILNVARANNIFIPAICYLSCCSPTLACRLCIADVDGKRAYTCNAKAKDGQVVITNTEEIEAERRAIMEVYIVNHPLECGVCDKSGECELQNYVLEAKVEEQHYAINNTYGNIENWGFTRYDPSLCIVCERCVTVCKDKIGEAALKTVPRGEELAVPKEYKDTMPKDAYAVWNKMQKSLIGKNKNENGEMISCGDCGECSAVCPVGALTSVDFHYASNAWELKKIPASNPHSSDCSLIYYEVKQTSISDPTPKIYRVSGDRDFAPLNRAARFGYDYANNVTCKDEKSFDKVVNFIQNGVGTITFNSFITNEEAFILQKIKEKFGLKLINEDAFLYQRFLRAMSKASGYNLYKGSTENVRKSDLIISVGSMLRYDMPNLAYAFNNALKMNKAFGIYAHPIHDKIVQNYSKNLLQLNYKIGSEEAILYLLLEIFAPLNELDDITSEYLQTFHTVETKVVNDEEMDINTSRLWEIAGLEDVRGKIEEIKASRENISLIIGQDILTHPRWENMAYIVGVLERVTNIKAVIAPYETNSLGVALICELDEFQEGGSFGYNRPADITISALGNGDLDMPSLNQQEGTFTNIDKRVVPTNAALSYKGYELNDIANALGIYSEHTIDYTKKLPEEHGFKDVEFDELTNYYDNAGNEHRGYLLENNIKEVSKAVSGFDELTFHNDVIYRLNPRSQFNSFVNAAHQTKITPSFYASKEFLDSHGFENGDLIDIFLKNGATLSLYAQEDINIAGEFAYVPTFDEKVNVHPLFKNYRFAEVTIKKAADE
ncbi:MAG: NADH-quinone oxidoreductase subunit G [Campylobacteraceae bacterium]|jgi:NADH-quinone oxidoreductase subunit G|nr:NADH-quinone oxidoreductase subunit G [Campylobacteraceae bacterium]